MDMKAMGGTLQKMLDKAGGDPVKMLRGPKQLGRYIFPRLQAEYTNWRSEQRAWREGVALLDLSYHQTDLYVRGKDAMRLFQRISANRLGAFPTGRGKQIIACSYEGYHITDSICFHLEDELFRVAGPPLISNWTQFHAETGDFDVELHRDETVSMRPGEPEIFIFQVQGPDALDTVRQAADGNLPEIKFFHIGEFKIAGTDVRALRHGMAGSPGFEIFGPWEAYQKVHDALIGAGMQYGIQKIGGSAYATTATESGWLPLPVPAVYTGEEMKPYREWLKLPAVEAMGSLGGSFRREKIEDYYVVSTELGHGRLIDFDEDFIGRDALKKRAEEAKRTKVSLVWNPDDVLEVQRAALFGEVGSAKYIDQPLPPYATFPYDEVRTAAGDHAGVSTWSSYSANARAHLSIGLIHEDHAKPGTELVLLWGDPDSARAAVEPNQLKEIRVTVAQAPYFHKSIRDD